MAAKLISVAAVFVFGFLNWAVAADTTSDVAAQIKEAQDAISAFKQTDPGLSRFFTKAAAYAVFPTATKGAVGIGEPAALASCSKRARRPARPRSAR